MALCNLCQHFKKRKNKTFIVCRERGTIKQRANNMAAREALTEMDSKIMESAINREQMSCTPPFPAYIMAEWGIKKNKHKGRCIKDG